MNELKNLLQSVQKSYRDFVDAMVNYALYSDTRKERLLSYLREYGDRVTSSDVLDFGKSFPDY